MPNISEEIKIEQKNNKYCFNFWCWFFQIGVWCLLIASIILVYFKIKIYIITFPIFSLFYLIYLFLNL